jgi:thiamine transport system permease protein
MKNEELRRRNTHTPIFNFQFSILNFLPALPALLFLAVFYIWPLAEIVRVSFTPSAISQGETPLTVLRDPATVRVLLFSLGQAMLSTLLTLLAGVPVAFVFARFRFSGQRLLRALAVVPFVMPTVVVAAAFSAMLGPRGALNEIVRTVLHLDQPPIQLQGTLAWILIAHVFYNVAVVIRIVGGALGSYTKRIEEGALNLGAARWQAVWHIALPMLLPAIGAAAALTFLYTFTSFGVVLVLGGARFATLEVEIYRQTSQFLRLDVSTSLALLQVIVTLAVSWASSRLAARASAITQSEPGGDAHRVPTTAASRALVWACVLFVIGLLVAPLVVLALRSLALGGEPLRYYAALSENVRGSFFFVPPWVAVRNSLVFAGITAVLAMGLGLPLAYAIAKDQSRVVRLIDRALLLPIGTSAVTLGLGYLITFDAPPLALRTSPWILPLAHTLAALPFFVRAMVPALRAFDPQVREAARGLGANAWQVFRQIDLPILGAPLAAATIFAFVISLGEFGASLLITRPEFPTMPVVIYTFLGQPGAVNYGQALAMSSLLMLVTAASVLVIERLNEGTVV